MMMMMTMMIKNFESGDETSSNARGVTNGIAIRRRRQ